MSPRGLGVATLVAIGLLGTPALFLAGGQLSPVLARHALVTFVGCAPLLFPYLWVLWLLRRAQPRRAAAVLALGAGSALAFCLPALLPALIPSRTCSGYRDDRALALVPIGQAVIVAAALWARRSLAGTDAISRWRLLWPLAFLFAAVVAVPSTPVGLHDRLDRNDRSAFFSISRINDCARDYAATNAGGYPPTLASCRVDGSPVRAETAGHLIRYEPAAPDAAGRISRYRVSAQPRESWCTSRTSYWSDESGVVHGEWTARRAGTESGGRQEP